VVYGETLIGAYLLNRRADRQVRETLRRLSAEAASPKEMIGILRDIEKET
jgi:hypothetical protein